MRHLMAVLAAWVLIGPPEIYDAGMPRRDDRQPLAAWDRLGTFDDATACRRFRDDRVVATYGRDDSAWALWSLAQCFTAQRAAGGPLSALDTEHGL